MNASEFNKIMGEIHTRWPMVGVWFNNQDQLDSAWFEVLEAVPFDEAMAEIRVWAFHGSPWKSASDWQNTAALLRRPWEEEKTRQDKFLRQREKIVAGATPTSMVRDYDSALSAVLTRVQRTPDDGLRQRIIDDYMRKRPADNPNRLPRYHCPLCLDNGVVICWLPKRSTTTFACHCDQAARYLQRGYIRYDPSRNLRYRSGNFERDFAAWSPLSSPERWKYETGKNRIQPAEDFGEYSNGEF
jgi:hypothetical protein